MMKQDSFRSLTATRDFVVLSCCFECCKNDIETQWKALPAPDYPRFDSSLRFIFIVGKLRTEIWASMRSSLSVSEMQNEHRLFILWWIYEAFYDIDKISCRERKKIEFNFNMIRSPYLSSAINRNELENLLILLTWELIKPLWADLNPNYLS